MITRTLPLIQLLVATLKHCERRLNEIPHQYMDTDFAKIRYALREGESWLTRKEK